MAYSTKPNEEDARQRLRAFWAGKSLGRPALDIPVKNPDFEPRQWPAAEMTAKARDLAPEWHAWQHAGESEPHLYYAERFPGHHVSWGSNLMHLPVYAGADYQYEDSAWCVHDHDLLDREPPAWDEHHWLVRKLDACYDAAKEARGDRGFITPPLMVDPLTCLSMIISPAQLCMELIDRGPRVRAWCAALNEIYINLYERYFQRLGYGESLCFFGPLAEGRSEGVQCDFATMLSPDMFGEFAFPELNDQCKYMDFPLYHHDGVCQLRHLDHLAALEGLSGIQWNPETTEKDHGQRLDAFRDMRRRGMCLHFSCQDVDQGLMLTRELGPDGLFLKLPVAKTTDEADAWIEQFEEASRVQPPPAPKRAG